MNDAETGELKHEDLLREQFEHSPDVIIMIDRYGRILKLNRDFTRDVPPETLIGMTAIGRLPSELRETAEKALGLCLETGVRQNFEHLTENGRWVHVRVIPINRPEGAARVMMTCSDISRSRKLEELLARGMRHFMGLVENAADAIFVIDTEGGRIVECNQAACDSLGYTREELFRMSVPDIDMNFDRDAVRDLWERLRSDEPLTIEGSYRRKDGNTFPAEIRLGLFEGEERRLVLALVRDATQRRRIEEELREKSEEVDRYFNLALDLLCIADAGFVFRRLNPQWEITLGYRLNEIEGKHFLHFVHPDDIENTKAAMAELSGGKSVFNFTNRYRCRDGSYRWIEWRATPYNGDFVYAAARDITEQRQAVLALVESEKKLRDVTAHIGVGLFVLDLKGHITYMNPAAEELLGWSFSELEGRNAHDLVHNCRADGSALALEECPIRRVIEKGGPFVSNEEVFVRKDGTVFPISVTASPIIEDGRVVASVATFRDISRTKRLERELFRTQKLESIGILAGGIAHDFNNLLQAIFGHISLARFAAGAGSRVFEQLGKAENALEQAKELSFRLLTFSKGGEPFKRVASMPDLIRQTVGMSLSGTAVTSEFMIPDGLRLVRVDEEQMRQVISNLSINAVEAMPQGGTLTVRAGNVRLTGREGLPVRNGDYLHISFQDCGCGIPAEHLQKIFDPYFSTKDMGSEKGMGLGLAICHSIIGKHEGCITVDSELGKGAVFHLYLPSAEEEYVSGGGVPEAGGAKKRILLMDDDRRVSHIVGQMLEFLEYDAELVDRGEDAVEAFRSAKEAGRAFDAVILDVTVPGGMGGQLTMKNILDIDPGARGIVSSGYVDAPIMNNFRDFGFAGAIAKPYRLEALKSLLCEVIS